MNVDSPEHKYYEYMKRWLSEPMAEEKPEELPQAASTTTEDSSTETENERMERLRREGEEWKLRQEEEERKAKEADEAQRIAAEEAQKELEMKQKQEEEERAAQEAEEEEQRKQKEEEAATLARLDADLDEINDLMDFGDDLGIGDLTIDQEVLDLSAPVVEDKKEETNYPEVPDTTNEEIREQTDDKPFVESEMNPAEEAALAEFQEIENLLAPEHIGISEDSTAPSIVIEPIDMDMLESKEDDDLALDAMLEDLQRITPASTPRTSDVNLSSDPDPVESSIAPITEPQQQESSPTSQEEQTVQEPEISTEESDSTPEIRDEKITETVPAVQKTESPKASEAKKIVKCRGFHGKNINLRVSVLITLEDLLQQLSSKFQQSLDGCILKYRDDCNDLVLIESTEDLELAFELAERRLDLVLEKTSEQEGESIPEPEAAPEPEPEPVAAPPPPPPAPLPPPLPAVMSALPKSVVKTTSKVDHKPQQSMQEEMLGFKLKKVRLIIYFCLL